MTDPFPTHPDTAPLTTNPEDIAAFRMGQLLVLLDTIAEQDLEPPTLERLGYYDFFSANPFTLFAGDSREHRVLRLAGLSPKALSYTSSSHRWTTRRQRLENDLALMVAHGLAKRVPARGRIAYASSETGRHIVEHLFSLHGAAYRRSAELVLARLRKLSDPQLVAVAQERFKQPLFSLDIYGDDSVQPGDHT
jgi:hypothetical protein